MKLRFSILLISFFFLTCKKDPPLPNQANAQQCNDTTHYPIGDTTYSAPRFNPNNSNEIIYVRSSTSTFGTSLVKRNLTTGQETFIVNDVRSQPDWSVKDWIVFNHADNQVWKIKSNGDSLQQLTTQGGLETIWDKSGNKIEYWFQRGQTAYNYYNFITDNNGNIIDTLFYPFLAHYGSWSYDNTKIASYCYMYDVGYIDLGTKQMTKVTNTPPDNSGQGKNIITDIDWMPNSQDIIWANEAGLYKTNIYTKQTTTLKIACDGRFYVYLSVSPDGKKIIAQRLDVPSGLCLMDIDGKNEIISK
jgi:hypothetical protein